MGSMNKQINAVAKKMRFSIENIQIFIVSTLLLCTLVACDNFADSPYPAIEFKLQAKMPDNGRSSAVGFAINGKGYVALGKAQPNSNYLKDCWEFSPDSNKWTQKADFPGVARVKAMSAVVNGKAYVGLGYAEGAFYQSPNLYLQDFWMFDPANNTWIQKKDFPGTGTDACVSFVYNDEIYLGSGYSGWGNTQYEFWKYSLVNDAWTKLADFTGSPRFGAVACTNGKRIFFGAGFKTYNTNDWWEYFPQSDSWKQVEAMPDGRVNAIALSVNDRFFVATGRFFQGNLTGGHVKSDITEYDADRNVWYNRGNIPNGNRENAISFVINGIAYIGFGENDQTVLNDLWSFKP
jgi:N-acetylneuraminic acid mutarotase